MLGKFNFGYSSGGGGIGGGRGLVFGYFLDIVFLYSCRLEEVVFYFDLF